MKLHCEICSRGGEHPGAHSEIASIISDQIKLPLVPHLMFGSSNPLRGIPPPWNPLIKFPEGFRCPRCNGFPFVLQQHELLAARKEGGPRRLLTDEGWVQLDERGICGRYGDEEEKPEPESAKPVVVAEKPAVDLISEVRKRLREPEPTDADIIAQAKRKDDEDYISYLCPFCKKTYKRADHFSKHLAFCKERK